MAAMSFLGCAAQLLPHPTHNLATVSDWFKVLLATGAARSGCNANRRAVRQCVQVSGITSQWINHTECRHVEGSSQITASQGILRNKWWTNVERWVIFKSDINSLKEIIFYQRCYSYRFMYCGVWVQTSNARGLRIISPVTVNSTATHAAVNDSGFWIFAECQARP